MQERSPAPRVRSVTGHSGGTVPANTCQPRGGSSVPPTGPLPSPPCGGASRSSQMTHGQTPLPRMVVRRTFWAVGPCRLRGKWQGPAPSGASGLPFGAAARLCPSDQTALLLSCREQWHIWAVPDPTRPDVAGGHRSAKPRTFPRMCGASSCPGSFAETRLRRGRRESSTDRPHGRASAGRHRCSPTRSSIARGVRRWPARPVPVPARRSAAGRTATRRLPPGRGRRPRVAPRGSAGP